MLVLNYDFYDIHAALIRIRHDPTDPHHTEVVPMKFSPARWASCCFVWNRETLRVRQSLRTLCTISPSF